MKTARPGVPARSADAALGRQTRGLVGPARRGQGARAALRGAGRIRGLARIVTPARAAALLGMLACGFAFTFVTGPSAFGLSRTDLPALTWTDPALVRETLAVPEAANVFRLDTGPLEAALRTLPAVASAEVSVGLPDAALAVHIVEREPVLAWEVGATRYIADRDGTIFATVSSEAALPAGLVVVEDRRLRAGDAFDIGGRLDAVDVDVATRLGSITPADIGSAAARLNVAVTDGDGFIVNAPGGWTAVFGFYSPATRSTDMVPGQVRLLGSLLDGRESGLSRIILASATDGTYIPRATPKPTSR